MQYPLCSSECYKLRLFPGGIDLSAEDALGSLMLRATIYRYKVARSKQDFNRGITPKHNWFAIHINHIRYLIILVRRRSPPDSSICLRLSKMHYSVPCRFLLCYAFSLSLSPITAQLLSTGSTVELGGVPYYVPSAAVLSLPTSFYVDVLAGANASDHPWIPITVVTASSKTLSIAGLKDILRSYNKNDDVWTNSFLQGR